MKNLRCEIRALTAQLSPHNEDMWAVQEAALSFPQEFRFGVGVEVLLLVLVLLLLLLLVVLVLLF